MSIFPYEFKDVTDEEDKLIKQCYKDYVRPFVRVGPYGHISPAGYADYAADIYSLDVRPDDIWISTFSRSGTTWLQELVWLVNNNLDYDAAKANHLVKSYAFIEYPTLASEINKSPSPHDTATVDDFRNLSTLNSPRYVKTHLPLSLLPPKLLDVSKVFYVARHPLDVAVSFFFMQKLFRYFDDVVTFEEYWRLFKNDLVFHSPISGHVQDAWQKRNHPNLMFLFYEEMQNDLFDVISRVCAFLGREYTQEQKQALAEYLKFENMKKNSTVKTLLDEDSQSEIRFMRKGRAGTWVNYFTGELRQDAEEYMKKYYSNTELRIPTAN